MQRRIEETIVFNPLRPPDLKKILELEIARASRTFLLHATTPFKVELSTGVKSVLLNHGCDTEYGAADLQHTLACEFQDPLYRLMATGQVNAAIKSESLPSARNSFSGRARRSVTDIMTNSYGLEISKAQLGFCSFCDTDVY